MENDLTESNFILVQEIMNKHFTAAFDECLREADVQATIAYGLPALSRAIGGLLASSETREGMESGLALCVMEIRRSMDYAFEIYSRGVLQ
jgi:hypothetical protein